MVEISQDTFCMMVATIAAGVMANPTSGTVETNAYGRTQILKEAFSDVEEILLHKNISVIHREHSG